MRSQRIPFIRFIQCTLFLLCFAVRSYATYDPPSERLPASGLWNPGLIGGIPSHSYSNVTCSGATGDDSSDDTSAIQTCINAANAYDAVYLPPGTYYVGGALTAKSNVVVRGAGKDVTYLRHPSTGGRMFNVGSYSSDSVSDSQGISSGYTKGSTQITVSDSGAFSAGDIVLITQTDNPLVSAGNCTWFKLSGHSMGQTNIVDTVPNSTTINLKNPLHYDFEATQSPIIAHFSSGDKPTYAGFGIEDLTIDRVDSSLYSTCRGTIRIYRAANCWVKNVRMDQVNGRAIEMGKSYRIAVQSCDIEEATYYSSGGSGYGVCVNYYSSDCLIENNVIRQHNANIHVENSGPGNVIAYNYMDVSVTGGGNAWFVYDVGGHCSTPYMMLLEGNMMSMVENDMVHGNNIYWMLFRNWFDARHTEFTSPLDNSMCTDNRSAVDLNSDAHYWTIVGNVLGRSGDSYGAYQSERHGGSTAYIYRQPGDSSDTLLRHGNYDYHDNDVKWCVEGNSEADCQGGSDDQTLRSSYYLTSKPTWWDEQGAGRPWPSIGPDVNGNLVDIPAKDRYEGETYGSGEIPAAPRNLRVITSE